MGETQIKDLVYKEGTSNHLGNFSAKHCEGYVTRLRRLCVFANMFWPKNIVFGPGKMLAVVKGMLWSLGI